MAVGDRSFVFTVLKYHRHLVDEGLHISNVTYHYAPSCLDKRSWRHSRDDRITKPYGKRNLA